MKKVICGILVSVLLLSIFTMPTSALGERQDVCLDLNAYEEETVKNEMAKRGIDGESIKVETLYDIDGTEKYLLGTTTGGYIIVEKGNFLFHEAGERNPYEAYPDAKKYYGGPMCYFAEEMASQRTRSTSANVYDIVSDEYVGDMYKVEFCLNASEQKQDGINSADAVTSEVKVGNSYLYIQRRAFGYNDDNTCSAVATGIVLNYLSQQYNKPFVNHTSELRDNGVPSSTNMSTKYPNAYALHRCLVTTYGMGAVSYALGIVDPLIDYLENEVSGIPQVTVSWTYAPKASTIKSNISDNKPVLITSTIAGDYSFHTMACYGYRENSGSAELLVHTGWYGTNYNSSYTSGGVQHYYQTETWISEGYASIGYYFSFNA